MNGDRKFNFQAILKTFSDEDVLTLHSLLYSEVDARVQEMIKNGNYPELNKDEKCLIDNKQTVSAIQAYRTRTGVSDMFAIRKIITNHKFPLK